MILAFLAESSVSNTGGPYGIYAKWPIFAGSICIKDQLYYFIQHQDSQDEGDGGYSAWIW